MPPNIEFSYEFFPVGQGLFSYGSLGPLRREQPFFQWVYDCGTDSEPKQQTIDGALDIMAARTSGQDQLNLLFISHLHEDHINGISSLLRRLKSVDTVLLPYVSFERLVLFAIEGGIDGNDPVFRFFTDPVGYLTSQGDVVIERILFVLPSGESGVAEEDQAPKFPEAPQGAMLVAKATAPEGAAYVTNAENGKGPIREFLPAGGSITVDAFWVFIPYNDDLRVVLPPQWISEVQQRKAKLASVASVEDRSLALYELKTLYRDLFGSAKQNALSLYLYTGPLVEIQPPRRMHIRVDLSTYETGARHRTRLWAHASSHDPEQPKASLIYTGDGTLKAKHRLDRMIDFFGQHRIDRCAVFQVMHHGSRYNWCSGLAARIAPCFSIFSSEPGKAQTYHPHAEVVKDFLPYCPIQVDTISGVKCEGRLHW